MITRACLYCEQQFDDPLRPGRTPRYCSDRCRAASHRASLPELMRVESRWACCDWPEERPCRTDGRPASVTDPHTWSTFAQVRPFKHKGFMLGGGIGCVEIDNCIIRGTSVLHPAVGDLVEPLMVSTYIEMSPSGTGLCIFGLMNEDRGWRRQLTDGVTISLNSKERFVAITGQRWSASSKLGHIRRYFHQLEPGFALGTPGTGS